MKWVRGDVFYRVLKCKGCELFKVDRTILPIGKSNRNITADCIVVLTAFYDKP